ncbi:uncharacterized protein LOC112455002 [Temnothorax curvispinosus]|uniref:Uncharacterized protein LOC112455002 n=1 Tax=Temnothorax curvispinosus TaxID=300111 RepID=A0A6J1PT58_9HYME|nr:uncharacterized protein LOC112455002 [Temnothorax curvispinosus]
MIKGGAQPLAQFIKRITERSIHLIPSDNSKTGYNYLNKRKNRLDDHQLPPGYTNFHQEIQFQDFLLTDKSPNNCCYLSNNSVVLVEHICCYKEIPVIVGRQFINTHPIADYPCDSRNLGIFDGRELSELQTWNIDEIDRKGFVVPYDADSVFKTYIMRHPDSLHQRNWRKRPRFLFRFSRQPIFHITDLHILLVNSQDMAAIQKHHNKQKRSMPSQASKGMSQAKIIKIRNMYLPPNKFKAGTDTANILNNSGVQIIENSSVAPVQNANKKYVSQLQKRSAQKISTSSPLHQDQTILEYLQDNAKTAEEQDDEYTYAEFLEDSSNDEVVGNDEVRETDEVVENDEVRENDEVVENDEKNNNQGDDALDNDEVIVNREDRPEIHPHDAAVCCNIVMEDLEKRVLDALNTLICTHCRCGSHWRRTCWIALIRIVLEQRLQLTQQQQPFTLPPVPSPVPVDNWSEPSEPSSIHHPPQSTPTHSPLTSEGQAELRSLRTCLTTVHHSTICEGCRRRYPTHF